MFIGYSMILHKASRVVVANHWSHANEKLPGFGNLNILGYWMFSYLKKNCFWLGLSQNSKSPVLCMPFVNISNKHVFRRVDMGVESICFCELFHKNRKSQMTINGSDDRGEVVP